jgi:cytochrome o ubiquinol oxidase subunit 2
MKNVLKMGLVCVFAIGFVLLLWNILQNNSIPVLEPSGMIGAKERYLIVLSTILMAIIVVPVFFMTALIAWRYRAGNTKAKYTPNWEHNRTEEFIWWAVPCVIIAALAVITWTSSHDLDPFKPIVSDAAPMEIQVIALPWKWLFIYPDQHIASVNFVEFPAGTPVTFQITGDAPMNSFWIPQLGGQIYAMAGMVSQLRLIADRSGVYRGSSANFSGTGFSGMTFTAKAVSQEEFNQWVQNVKQGQATLSTSTYALLAAPSQNEPVRYYAAADSDVFSSVVSKFMMNSSLIHHD